jgi:DNA-binding beta-propeller fold protein YncE
MKRLPLLLVLLPALAVTARAQYKVVAHFPIGGDTSSFDYLRVDPVARRLYVSHEKRFEVLDADTGKKVGEIGPASRAHGIAIAPDSGHGFTSSGIDDAIIMFDLRTLAPLKTIKSTGSNPDAIDYDPESKRIYAANHGDGKLTVLDPVSGAIVATIDMGGKLEAMGFDGRGQGFVNLEDKSSVGVFDTHTFKPKAVWSSAPGEGGTGLAVDAAHHRVFTACANQQVVVLDSDTGKVIATPASGEDPDGLAYDPKAGFIFTSNPDGTLSVIRQEGADHYTSLPPIATKVGARTIALDPTSGRLFLSAPNYGPKPAPVKGGPRPRAPILAGTFEVVVVGTK